MKPLSRRLKNCVRILFSVQGVRPGSAAKVAGAITRKGCARECAPDLGVEMAAAQATEIGGRGLGARPDGGRDKHLSEKDWREEIRATCPQCEAPLANNAKFCPECGAKIKQTTFCSQCGAKMASGTKVLSGVWGQSRRITMELWLTEKETDNLGLTCRVKETLFSGKSDFSKR